MTTGSGLYINPAEKDPFKQNTAIRQLIEGRSNAVGIVTLAHVPAASTVVKAPTCSPTSAVFLFPANIDAQGFFASPYVKQSDVVAGQFTISHLTFSGSPAPSPMYWWVCLG